MFALRSLLPILPLVALVPRAAAHGYIASVSIDGKVYDGPYFGEGASHDRDPRARH